MFEDWLYDPQGRQKTGDVASEGRGFLSVLKNKYAGSNTNSYICSDFACGVRVTEDVAVPLKMKMSEVKLEELDGDLTSGVRLKKFGEVEIGSIHSHPRDIYYNKHFESGEVCDEPNTRILTLETHVKWCDLVNTYEPWVVFMTYGCSVLETVSTTITPGKKDHVKCVQRFKVKLTGKYDTVPCLQMYCAVKKLRFVESTYREGEIINFFIRNKKSIDVPNPPMLTITPRYEQTYVCLEPRQRLQIVTDQSDYYLSFNPSPTVEHIGSDVVSNWRVNSLTTGKLRSDYFECVKTTRQPETILIRGNHNNSWRAVIVPVASRKDSKFPLIVDPIRSCLLYAYNIEGFIFRSYNRLPLQIHKDCPLKIDYSANCANYYEAKCRIKKWQPFFCLERYEWAWVAKCL